MPKVRVVLTQDEARALHYLLKEQNSQTLSDAHGKIVSALIDAEFKQREKTRNTPVKEKETNHADHSA